LLSESKGRAHLHRLLRRLDAPSAARISEQDKPKVIRALEVRLETGKSLSEHLSEQPRHPLVGFKVHFVGLNPDRAELYRRIDQRVCRMFEAGLEDEVRQLLQNGIPPSAKPFEALGYRHVIANFESCIPNDETIRIIQRDTRRYAKRQMTWFRKQSEVQWFDGPGDSDEIKNRVRQHLEKLVNF
jgi:tRNA dimethylallyltransferase